MPRYPQAFFSARSAQMDEDQRRILNSRVQQQTLLARFGCLQAPGIVTPATVLPCKPAIPDCGERKPRLRSIQIIALAIINHPSCAPTGKDILEWIQKQFPYFGLHSLALARIRTMLKDFFYDYDPPIIPLSTEYRNFAMPGDVEEFYTTSFAIVVGHFSILFPTNRGVFPLMKLPAELRLEIYEYSLSMPCKEWVRLVDWGVSKKQRNKEVSRLHSRVFLQDERVYGYGASFFRSPPMKDKLALLEVSRSVHGEVVPIFYRLNTLSIGDFQIPYFSCALSGMVTSRQRFVRSLSIGCPDLSSLNYWTSACQSLRNCFELEKIILDVTQFEEIWRSYHPSEFTHALKPLTQVRGIKDLKISCRNCLNHSQEVHETIEEYLKPLITQPREDKPVHHSTGETRMTTYAAPIAEVSAGLDNTKKRTSATEPGHGEHNGEDAGGDEVQQNQSKKLKVAA